jgi:hypothetical protein
VTTQDSAPVTGVSNVVSGRYTVCREYRDDIPAVGVRLTLERYAGIRLAPAGPWSTVTDADGRFVFPVMAGGPYTLTVEPPAGYVPNDAGRVIDVLVTGEGVRWSAGLTITTEDPATTCLSRA